MLMFPINYIYITQLFKKGEHNGLDMRGKNRGEEVAIYSPESGTVIEVRNNYKTQDKTGTSYGNYIKIDHGNGVKTLMAHLKYNSVLPKVGQTVTKGEKIATMGTTGNSTGIHVHYEVFINNVKSDPLLYTYVYRNQIVDSVSQKYVKYITYISPAQKNENINQLKVNVQNLSIRENAGLSYKRIGFVEKGKYYNYYEVKTNDNYTWYKIGNNAWIANDGKYLTILTNEEQTQNSQTPVVEENNQIGDVESDLKEYKLIYTATKKAKYIIELDAGEILYVK